MSHLNEMRDYPFDGWLAFVVLSITIAVFLRLRPTGETFSVA